MALLEIDQLNPKKLHLENYNNKLQCDAFVEINFAPKTKFETKHTLQPYVLPNGAIVKLIDVYLIKFDALTDVYTLPAMGMRAGEFWRWWWQSYPDTTEDTMMGIYFYKREKSK